MGLYINPPEISIEEWLKIHGKIIGVKPPKACFQGDYVAVCMVDNGLFTAAGIAFDAQEFEAFKWPDERPKLWFWVHRDRLREVNPQYAKIAKSAADLYDNLDDQGPSSI